MLPVVIVVGAQALLIFFLWVALSARKRAQRDVAEQVKFEQLQTALSADAIRHAYGSARALEDALARIGAYASARRAVLIDYAEAPARESSQLTWSWRAPREPGMDYANAAETRLEIPLMVNARTIGVLQLFRQGTSWPIKLASRLIAASDVIANAIDRCHADEAMRRSEELNRAVLASLSSQIAILDRNGTIMRVNDSWREIARVGQVSDLDGEFVGANYLQECRMAELRGCADAAVVHAGVKAVLEGKVSSFRYQYSTGKPDWRWYEMSVDRLDHSRGGAIVMHLDITERRLAERRAEETRLQIAHLGRVAIVSDLAVAVSHELKQPLSAIRSNAEAGAKLLSSNPEDVPEAKAIFRDIVSADERAMNVIDHIMRLLRKEEPALGHVDVNKVCLEAMHILEREAESRRVRVHLAIQPELPSVWGDSVQLQQVVLNLMLNAFDAAASSAARHEVTVGTRRDGDDIEIFVRDTGSGLRQGIEQHLFEPFFSTKANGLGMGLVIVRSIAERHQGSVYAENVDGGGAEFRVRLPKSDSFVGRVPAGVA